MHCTMKDFGARVAYIREKRRMDRSELAERAQISVGNLWKIEHGTIGESGVFTAARLASALGCTVDYLVGMHEEE